MRTALDMTAWIVGVIGWLVFLAILIWLQLVP
jgi:hypothetical protein